MSTFQRLGMAESCQMHGYARLMRTDRQLRKLLGNKTLSRLIAVPCNYYLRTRNHKSLPDNALDIAPLEGSFGEEFTALDRQLTGAAVIRCRRSAEYLNWRFREDPLNHYTVLTARRRNQLVGFAILAADKQDAHLLDICGAPEVSSQLVEAAANAIKDMRVETLRATISQFNPLSVVLQERGFWFRAPAARVIAYCSPEAEMLRNMLDSPNNWVLTHSDILA
ncbi:MAG: hypothetical protein LAP85_06360 [Acidobacteriia bacterium]|nr:hypothetical protein [Terriglobia bacterium]